MSTTQNANQQSKKKADISPNVPTNGYKLIYELLPNVKPAFSNPVATTNMPFLQAYTKIKATLEALCGPHDSPKYWNLFEDGSIVIKGKLSASLHRPVFKTVVDDSLFSDFHVDCLAKCAEVYPLTGQNLTLLNSSITPYRSHLRNFPTGLVALAFMSNSMDKLMTSRSGYGAKLECFMKASEKWNSLYSLWTGSGNNPFATSPGPTVKPTLNTPISEMFKTQNAPKTGNGYITAATKIEWMEDSLKYGFDPKSTLSVPIERKSAKDYLDMVRFLKFALKPRDEIKDPGQKGPNGQRAIDTLTALGLNSNFKLEAETGNSSSNSKEVCIFFLSKMSDNSWKIGAFKGLSE